MEDPNQGQPAPAQVAVPVPVPVQVPVPGALKLSNPRNPTSAQAPPSSHPNTGPQQGVVSPRQPVLAGAAVPLQRQPSPAPAPMPNQPGGLNALKRSQPGQSRGPGAYPPSAGQY